MTKGKTEKAAEGAPKDESGDTWSAFVGKTVIGIVVAVVVLYVGGWSVVWGKEMYSAKSLLITSNGFAILFNGLYYGLKFTDRFFNSPALSWICLMAATGMTPVGFFFRISGDDEEL